MNEEIVVDEKSIESKIYTIRGLKVMLDRDLADFYKVETRALKQAVKRNIERFPHDFMFEGDEKDIEFLVSQSVIPSKKYLGGAKPFFFTEQGVANLSSVLTSKTAIEINIKIIRTFVSMRKVISQNAGLFQRLENVEQKLLKHDENFSKLFNALESKDLTPKQGIFYDGQVFDAYVFVSNLIKKATKEIILIDNYIDESVLTLLTKRSTNVKATIYTKNITKQLELDLKKYNEQYPKIEIKKFELSHDRFLIIDEELYHVGASLKDLGKRWFGFSRMDKKILKSVLYMHSKETEDL